jgi:hypothetical protein
MSKETSSWLNNNVLIGLTDKRGHAWHYRKSEQGAEPNHLQTVRGAGRAERNMLRTVAGDFDTSTSQPSTRCTPCSPNPAPGRWHRVHGASGHPPLPAPRPTMRPPTTQATAGRRRAQPKRVSPRFRTSGRDRRQR